MEFKPLLNPEQKIMPDCWTGYSLDKLKKAGFVQFTVNHKYHFVDPDFGASTEQVEGLWGSTKLRNKR